MCWLPPYGHGWICWPLQRHFFEMWNGIQGELHSCLHLVDVPYIVWLIDLFLPCIFLEMNLRCAHMWKMYVPHNWRSIYEKEWIIFCPRVDVVPNYIQDIKDSWVRILTILHTWLSMFGEDFRHNQSKILVFPRPTDYMLQFVHFSLLYWGRFYTLLYMDQIVVRLFSSLWNHNYYTLSFLSSMFNFCTNFNVSTLLWSTHDINQ